MPDNVELNPGAGGDSIAADEIAGIKHQRVKVQFGAEGAADDVSAANPLPVTSSGTSEVNLASQTAPLDVSAAPLDVNVQGTVPVSAPADLDVNLNAQTAPLDVSAATVPVSVQGTPSVDATIVGQPLDVSGATVPVAVQGTVPVSAPASLDVEIQNTPNVAVPGGVAVSTPAPIDVSAATVPVAVQGTPGVDIASQTAPLDVSAAAVDVNVQGTPNVEANIASQTAPLDVSAAAVDVNVQGSVPITSTAALDVNVQGTVPISTATNLDVNIASQDAPVDVAVQGSVPITSASALDVNVQGTVPISSGLPLDVSAATVPVSVQGTPSVDASGSTVSVAGTVPVSVADPLDVNVQGTVPVSVAADLDVNIASQDAPVDVAVQGTVPISSAVALDVNVQGTVPVSVAADLDVNIASQDAPVAVTGTVDANVQGTVPVSVAAPLDVSAATVPVQIQGTPAVDATIVGQPLDVSAAQVNVNLQDITYSTPLRVSQEPQLVAPSGTFRFTEPHCIIDSQFTIGPALHLWSAAVTPGGAANYSFADQAMSLDVTGNGSVINQTRVLSIVPTGKSVLHMFGALFGPATNNVTKQVGLFDTNDGIFLQNENFSYAIVRRRAGVDTPVARASWNVDQFDGTGPSGVTIDFTRPQVLWIEQEWVGVGQVTVGFTINGVRYPAHRLGFANLGSTAHSLGNLNLPHRYEIFVNSALASASLIQMGSATMCDGPVDNKIFPSSVSLQDNAPTAGISNNQLFEIVAVRLKSFTLGRANYMASRWQAFTGGSDDLRVCLVANPVWTNSAAGTWNSVGPLSAMEWNSTRNADSLVPGTEIILASAYKSNAFADFSSALTDLTRLGVGADGTPDVLSLCAEAQDGNATVYGAIDLLEFF